MARFRLSRPARADIANILTASEDRWGIEGRLRYAAILARAIRFIASHPEGPTTRTRRELAAGLRSLHLRHARRSGPRPVVERPVHVLYYRMIAADLIEIVRVLHERMEPGRYLGVDPSKE